MIRPDVVILVNVGEQAEQAAFSIAEQLRNANISSDIACRRRQF